MYKVVPTDEFPYTGIEEDIKLDPNVMYLYKQQFAYFLCPCGCGDVIRLNLSDKERPCWALQFIDDIPTIRPSINKLSGCKSHFFIRDGKVVWC